MFKYGYSKEDTQRWIGHADGSTVTDRVYNHYEHQMDISKLERFGISGVRRVYYYCNRDGLFCQDIVKGIDDKKSGYDDARERRELEKAADMLFGRESNE